jgi:hypothetical protein
MSLMYSGHIQGLTTAGVNPEVLWMGEKLLNPKDSWKSYVGVQYANISVLYAIKGIGMAYEGAYSRKLQHLNIRPGVQYANIRVLYAQP